MIINADKTNLNKLLGVPNRQLTIPPYQRPYAWESEQIDELWHDIIDTVGRGHFMGSVVLCSPDEQRPEIIDGQQRMTTIIIILSLIRDKYKELKPDLIGRIQQFLENSYADPDLKFKFKPGNANKHVFTEFVLRSPEDPSRRSWDSITDLDSHEVNQNKNLIANTERLSNYLNDYLENDSDPLRTLERLEKTIMTGLEFVVIDVPDIANAFIIFETLNDRGLALSAGDLLKNHLLAAAAKEGESVEDLADDWARIINCLQGGDVTRFLRHYLLIYNSKVQKDEVFSYFKKEVSSKGVKPLISILMQMAEIYGRFINPALVDNPDLRDIYENLSTLRATMCYSSLLSASVTLDEKDLVGFSRLCEILTFRYSTICSKDSKELERYYHLSAKELADNGKDRLTASRSILESVLPSKEEFVIAFKGQSLGRHYIVNYVLRGIENSLESEEKQIRDTQKVHIEHIMPQTLSEEWKAVLGEELEQHELNVNRWGNLTLLGGKKNIKASNKLFDEKKDIYNDSQISMTRDLVRHDKWGFEEIDSRQLELANLADTTWSV